MTYIVPNGMTLLNIFAKGGGGGGGSTAGNGGNGGSVNANFIVQPGDELNWYIGKGGDYGGGNTSFAGVTFDAPSNSINGFSVSNQSGGANTANGGVSTPRIPLSQNEPRGSITVISRPNLSLE